MSDVDYDKLIRESKANRSIDLQGSVSLGSEFNADEEARYQGLAQKSGLPVDAVRYDADRVEALHKRESIDYDKLIKESPKVSEWLRSVPNAQVAHDDVESLSAIEQAWRKVKDLGNAYVEGGLKSVGEGMQGIPEFVKSVGRTVGRATGTLDDFQNLDRVLGDYDDKLLDVLAPQAKVGREISDIAKTFEIPNDRRGYVTELAGGLGQITTQALLPGAGTLFAGAQETQQFAERAKRAGTYGTAKADAGTILGTGASYGLEHLGMASVFQRLPPKLRSKVLRHASDVVLAGAGEGLTEAAQSLSSDLFTQKLIDKEHEAFQSFGQEGAVGFGVGAIARGVLNAITPGRLRYSEDAQNAANAMQQGERLTQFLSIVKDSKLRQRSPERFESLVATFKESNAETVGVPLQALRTYAQTQNLATEALVSELTGGTGAMVEASVTGGDVRIPVEKFIASNHAIALAPDARLTPTGMTANEAAAWGEKDGGEELKALMAELEQQSQQVGPAVESSKKVYNDVYAKAIAAGEPEFRASVIARVQQSRYLARAASLGAEGKQVDPYELYKSLDTSIGNELQGESSYDQNRKHLGEILERNFNDPLVESYIMLTDPEESFRYPQSSSEDFVALAEESLKPLLGENVSVEKLDSNTSRVDENYHIVTKTIDDKGLEQEHTAGVYRSGKNVTLNISDSVPGAAGSAIYQAVATWAHNNGYVFIEDPAGLSETSIYRRPENMLSSAIRYGTAAHLGSGEMMRAPSKYLSADAVPLDLAASKSPIRDLIVATVSNVEDIVPQSRNFGYDFATGEFFNKQTMTEMTDEDIAGMIRTQEGDRRLESVLFGVNSLKRAIIGRTLIDEERMLGPDKMRSLARKRAAEGKALPRVFYQQQNPMWYSAVLRAVNSAGLKKAPLKQWIATLTNAPGVRKEELDDMGLLELAKLTPDQVYSKEEFVDATQNSVLDVQEVLRGEKTFKKNVEEFHEYFSQNEKVWNDKIQGSFLGDPNFDMDDDEQVLEFNAYTLEQRREIFEQLTDGTYGDVLFDEYNKYVESNAGTKEALPPKHPNYVEPGGKDYREVVLTLPGQIEPYKPDTFHFTDEGGGTAIAWIRFNTREDAQGNKVLYIEEIQSKRHQDAREKGYVEELTPEQKAMALQSPEGANLFGVPDAPMKNTSTWAMLAMKRMIRYAVDNGFDAVAWTPGSVQNKRWGLSRVIQSVEVFPYKRPDGTVKFNVDFTSEGRGADGVTVLEDGRMINTQDRLFGISTVDKKLSDFVGKELADKIMSVTEQTKFSGEDLEIGGEGMRSFYDKMLVNETNKYIKKFGSKVEVAKQISASKERAIEDPLMISGMKEVDQDILDTFGVGENFDDGTPARYSYFDNGDRIIIVGSDGVSVMKGVNDLNPQTLIAHDWEETPESWGAANFMLGNLAGDFEFAEAVGWSSKASPSIKGHVFPITDKMKDAVSMGQPLYQTAQTQPVRRGAVQFDDAGNRLIALFKDANESTLLHEFGHTWLEELRADSKDKRATGQLKADWETIKKWFIDNGHPIGDDGSIPVEAHELFARGIERYFMEGNAPTPELRSVFQTFKDWLLKIYRTVASLNAPINKDVRAVFDRLIATQESIDAARAKIGRRATFASAKEMGVADEVFEAYQKAAADANDRELSRAEKEAMAEVARQQDEEFRDALTRNREAVRKELEQRPEYRAIHWIRNGTLPDGSTIEGVAHARLDAAAVKALYPNDDLFVRRVQRAGLYSLQGGLDPEMVAPLFGYANADAMLRATVAAPRMAVLVKQEAERRTKEEFGDMLIDLDRRMNIALEAVHSDESGRILRAELAALRKLHKDSRPVVKQAVEKVKQKKEAENAELDAANRALKLLLSSERKERAYENRWRDAEQNTEEAQAREAIASVPEVKWFRDAARKLVGASKIQDIDRQAALRTERAMSKQAYELALKKDYAGAAQAKAWQLFNHYLYLEQSRALEQTAKIKKFAKGLTKSSAQERLGKAGQDYLDQVNALLERYEFKEVSDKKIDRRASLLEWIKEQEAEGNEIAIPEEIILDARQINYQLLTFDGLNALHDALQNITQLARLKNKLLRNKQKVEYEETITELLQALKESRQTSTPPPIDRNTISRWKKAGDVIDSLDATLLKAEQIFRWFDKEDPNGVWMQTVFQPIADAQGEENALTKTFTEKFAKMFEDYFADRKGVLWSAKLNPAIGQEMTHGGAIAVALNVGNAGNKEKLLKGYKWNEQQLNSILDTLTKEDWQFVQSVWNEVNRLWPQMKDLQQRLTGVAPPKVEPIPVTTKFGVLQGGYFPVVYDERFSPVGEKQADAAGERLMERSYVKATTSQGHTKARTRFYAPIKLDLEVIPQHMAQVIHDLTHREAIIQAHKVLNDKRVREEITNRMGLPYHKALNAWLKGVANSTNVDQTGNEFWSRVMARTRMNANIVAMGYKFTTIAANTLGYVQAMEQVNPLTLMNEVRRFWMNPRKAIREVHSRSKEMEFRSVNIERDMRDLYLRNLGKTGVLTEIHRYAFKGISLLDQAISVPAWRAAYADAIKKGATEQEAINTADSVVRLTQSAGAPKDLASIQRSSEFFKWATMFYSYYNMVYNRLRSLGKTNKVGAAKFAEIAWRSMLLVVVPAVVGELLAGRGPDDDDEPEEWALKKILLYPAMTVPFARDLASSLDSGFESRTPVGAFLNALRRSIVTTGKVIEGEKELIDLAKPLNTALGYAIGLPAGQMNITGAYLWDLYTGEEVPESMLEVAKNLLYRREE